MANSRLILKRVSFLSLPVQNSHLNLHRFKVVLVGTKTPENIGSVARLLENYAVGEGALVSPNCEWREGVAQWMATGPSIDRLNALPVFDSLAEAVSDCTAIIGFTARSGRTRRTSIKIEDLGQKFSGKVALVFGREDFCLLKEEIDVCTHLCALDTSPHFPALNLSHSVAVVLSQVFLQETNSRKGHHKVVTAAELEPMIEHLKQMMVEVDLTEGGNPERMLSGLKKIFQRAELTSTDISLLRGLYSRVQSKIKE
jgi:TrmH family RNA methyltransferase